MARTRSTYGQLVDRTRSIPGQHSGLGLGAFLDNTQGKGYSGLGTGAKCRLWLGCICELGLGCICELGLGCICELGLGCICELGLGCICELGLGCICELGLGCMRSMARTCMAWAMELRLKPSWT